MTVLEIEYQGDDLIIPKEVVEKELGLHPGDRVEVRLKTALLVVEPTPETLVAVKRALESLRQAFDPAELADWETSRKALWATWKPPI
jgi:antitoxin component of MazEF toxin-antitoxin module